MAGISGLLQERLSLRTLIGDSAKQFALIESIERVGARAARSWASMPKSRNLTTELAPIGKAAASKNSASFEARKLWIYYEIARSPPLMRALLQVGEWSLEDERDVDAVQFVDELFALEGYDPKWVRLRPGTRYGPKSKRKKHEAQTLAIIRRAYSDADARRAWLKKLVRRFPRPLDVLEAAVGKKSDLDSLWVKDPEDGDLLVCEWVLGVLSRAEPSHQARLIAVRTEISPEAGDTYERFLGGLKTNAAVNPPPFEHVSAIASKLLNVSNTILARSRTWAEKREAERAGRVQPVSFPEADLGSMRPLLARIRANADIAHLAFDRDTPDSEDKAVEEEETNATIARDLSLHDPPESVQLGSTGGDITAVVLPSSEKEGAE